MIEMFPNWASVFNVSPPKKNNNKQTFITTQQNNQNNQYDVNNDNNNDTDTDKYPRAWRRVNEDIDIDPIVSTADELRTSYDQYWEEVRQDNTDNATTSTLYRQSNTDTLENEMEEEMKSVAKFLSLDLLDDSNTVSATVLQHHPVATRSSVLTLTPLSTSSKYIIVFFLLLCLSLLCVCIYSI